MAIMNKYAKWMSENAASIHSGGYSGKNTAGNPVTGKYAIIFDTKTGLQWATARAGELNAAIETAIAKTKTTPRPLHEANANAQNIASELAAAKARIAELEGKASRPVPPKSDDEEPDGPSGLSIEQAGKARLKK